MVSNFIEVFKNHVVLVIYCMVGLTSALIDVVGLKLFSEYVGLSDIYAVTIAYIMGMLFNYTAHSVLTFKTKMSRNCFVKYLIVVALNYFLALLIVILLKAFGLTLILSKILSLPVIFLSGFILSKRWIYK